MADRERLIDELDYGVERELLLIGLRERPPVGARERMIASVLSGTGTSMTAAAVVSKPSTVFGALAKWLTLGAVAAGLPGAASTVSAESHLTPAVQVSTQKLQSPERGVWMQAPVPPPPAAQIAEPPITEPPRAQPLTKASGRKTPNGAVWIGVTEVTVEGERRTSDASQTDHH